MKKTWSLKPGSKAKAISAILAITLSMLLVSACGNNNQQSAKSEASSPASEIASANVRPLKDGFDAKTNFSTQVAGVNFSIPDYYALSKNSGEMDWYYAEQGRSVAMIGFEADKATISTEKEFRSTEEQFVNSFVEGTDTLGLEIVSMKDISIAGLPGCYVELNGAIDNMGIQAAMLLFFNESASSRGVVSFAQTDNTLYDYSADFEKIIQSAKVGATTTDKQADKSSSSSASATAVGEKSASASKASPEQKVIPPAEPSEEEKLAALESVMPRDTAYKAATVSFTNQIADDVFASDGNTLDPSKFHSYSDQSGFHLVPKSEGAWSYVDKSTWHVENLEYTIADYGTSVKASCDVHFDGTDYIISNQSGLIYNPGHEEWGTPLEEYSGSSADLARTVTSDLLS